MENSLISFARNAKAVAVQATKDANVGMKYEDSSLTCNLSVGDSFRGLKLIKRLGNGCSRVSYETDKGTCLKFPHTDAGIVENLFEGFLLLALMPAGRTPLLVTRHRKGAGGGASVVLEVEMLTKVANGIYGNRDAMGLSKWTELSTVVRVGLGFMDWLQTGYSPSQSAWVTYDIANPWGSIARIASASEIQERRDRDLQA